MLQVGFFLNNPIEKDAAAAATAAAADDDVSYLLVCLISLVRFL